MSIQFNERAGKWEVRWREGGKQPSRLFARKGDAKAFELELGRRRQLGALAPGVLQSRVTLAEFVAEDWWPRHAIPNLAADTRRRYLEVWGSHLLPRMGDYELRQISPLLIEDLREQLSRSGVGAATQRKALMMLQGILKRAVVRGLIPSNPVQSVGKPRQAPARSPQPLSPLAVERIRVQLRQRDAVIVSLLAYAGLRPDEMMRLTWESLKARTLHVHALKTGRSRDVDVLGPLAQDLAEWRMVSGRPSAGSLIVARPSGGPWGREDWGNWRSRVYRSAAEAADVTGDMRPYRLRGSFVSLLLWEGRSLAYVAEQAGHSIATLAKHYAGVIRELEDAPRVSAQEAIRNARERIWSATSVRKATGA